MLALLLLLAGCGPACGGGQDCRVASGRYLAVEPSGWDGRSPLPVVVFAHGYNGTPEQWARQDVVMQGWSNAGLLVVLPEGRGGDWNLANTLGADRDEQRFFTEVLDDVEARWPVDAGRIFASGHSIGGSMTHQLACELSGRFRAFAPMGGAFWDPVPEACPAAGPVSMRHLHGLADQTFPLEGRPIGEMRQGDVRESVAMWARHDGCDEVVEELHGDQTWQVWRGCARGEVTLCLHPGGHRPPQGWVQEQTAWFGSF